MRAQDRVRSRAIAVLSFLLIFCMVFAAVLSPALLDPYNRPQRVAATSVHAVEVVGAGASSRATVGVPMGFQPQVRVASPADLPLANRSVSASATLLAPTRIPLWGLDVVPGSLLAAKIADLSRQFMGAAELQTSAAGLASFTNLSVRGQPGNVVLKFQADTHPDGAASPSSSSPSAPQYLTTSAGLPVPNGGGIGGKLCYVDRPLIGTNVALGVPVAAAASPRVRCITDFGTQKGEPVPGVRCVVNTLPYSGAGAKFFRKMALLKNNAAPPTDKDGYATFEGLEFSASSTRAQIPLYNCEGTFALLPTFRPPAQPLLLGTPVAKIAIAPAAGATAALPAQVLEGESFAASVLLTDEDGHPVAGQRAVAMIVQEAGGMDYSEEHLAATKHGTAVVPFDKGDDGCVLCMVPGMRSKKLTGTVFSDPSGADGIAYFPALAFAPVGPAGSYRIAFLHAGLRADPADAILVLPRVASVSLVFGSGGRDAVNYTALINATTGADGSLLNLPAVVVSDAAGAGVPGKSVRVLCAQEGDNADGHVVLSYRLGGGGGAAGGGGTSSSGEGGGGVYEFLSLRFLVARSGTYTLRVDVNGVQADTTISGVEVVNADPDTSDQPCAHIKSGMHGTKDYPDDVHSFPSIPITSNDPSFKLATTPIAVNSHGSPAGGVAVMVSALKQFGQTRGDMGVSRQSDGVVEYNCSNSGVYWRPNCYSLGLVVASAATYLIRYESYTVRSDPGKANFGIVCSSNMIAGQISNPVASIQWKVRPPSTCVAGMPFDTRPEVTLLDAHGNAIPGGGPHHHAVSFRLVDFPKWITTLPRFSMFSCAPAFSPDVDNTWCQAHFSGLLFDDIASNSSGLEFQNHARNHWSAAADAQGNIRWPSSAGLKAGLPGSYTVAAVVDGVMGPPHTINCPLTVANIVNTTVTIANSTTNASTVTIDYVPVVQSVDGPMNLDVVRWPGVISDPVAVQNLAIAPGELQLQQSFDPQPIIRVTDSQGRPVPGVRVQAVPSWSPVPGKGRLAGNDVDLMGQQVWSDAYTGYRTAETYKTVCGTVWSAKSNASGHAVFNELAIFQKRSARYQDPWSGNPSIYIHYQIPRDPMPAHSANMSTYGCFQQSQHPPFAASLPDTTNIWAQPTDQSGSGPPGVKAVRWVIRTNPKVRWKGVQFVRRPSKEATFNNRVPVQPIVEVLPRNNSQPGGGYENSVQAPGWWVVPVVSVFPRPYKMRKVVIGCGPLGKNGEMPTTCEGVQTKDDGRAYFQNLNVHLKPDVFGFSRQQDNAGLYKIAFVAYPPTTGKLLRTQSVGTTIPRIWGAKSEDTSFWAYITVKTVPQRIDVEQSPPPKILVGEPFVRTVKVKVGLANGAGLGGQAVTARMVNAAADASTKNDELVRLDPARRTVFTDTNGVATFRLVVDAAPPADYQLDFETHDGLFSSATEGHMTVVNDVANVTVIRVPLGGMTVGDSAPLTDETGPQCKVVDAEGNALSKRRVSVRIVAGNPSRFAAILDADVGGGTTAITTEDGVATFSDLRVLDGDACDSTNAALCGAGGQACGGCYHLICDAAGIVSPPSGGFSLANPFQLDTTAIAQWKQLMYLFAALSVPLFLGNSHFVPADADAGANVRRWGKIALGVACVLAVAAVGYGSRAVADFRAEMDRVYAYPDPFRMLPLIFLMIVSVTLLVGLLVVFVLTFWENRDGMKKEEEEEEEEWGFSRQRMASYEEYMRRALPRGSRIRRTNAVVFGGVPVEAAVAVEHAAVGAAQKAMDKGHARSGRQSSYVVPKMSSILDPEYLRRTGFIDRKKYALRQQALAMRQKQGFKYTYRQRFCCNACGGMREAIKAAQQNERDYLPPPDIEANLQRFGFFFPLRLWFSAALTALLVMFAIAFYVLAFRYVQHSVDDFATSCVLAKMDLVGGNREFSARIGAAQERADFALSGVVDANTVFGQRMDQVLEIADNTAAALNTDPRTKELCDAVVAAFDGKDFIVGKDGLETVAEAKRAVLTATTGLCQVVSAYGDAIVSAASAIPRIGDSSQEALEAATSLCEAADAVENVASSATAGAAATAVTKAMGERALSVCGLLEAAAPPAVEQARKIAQDHLAGITDAARQAKTLANNAVQMTLASLVAANDAIGAGISAYESCNFECQVEAYRVSVNTRLMVACALSVLFAVMLHLLSWRSLFARYRNSIFELRKGKTPFAMKRSDVSPNMASKYIGLQVWHAVIAFVGLLACATPVGLLLAVPDKIYDLVNFLGPYIPWDEIGAALRSLLLSLLGVSLVVTLLQTVAGLFTQAKPYHGGMYVISRRWLYALLDNCSMFIVLASGLGKVILRAVVAVFGSLHMFFRLDVCQAPEQTAWLDQAHHAWAATLLVDHAHNNPIVTVACAHFLRAAKAASHRRKGGQGERGDARQRLRQRMKNRLWLAMTLHNNPQLRFQRGKRRQGRELAARTAASTAGAELYGNLGGAVE